MHHYLFGCHSGVGYPDESYPMQSSHRARRGGVSATLLVVDDEQGSSILSIKSSARAPARAGRASGADALEIVRREPVSVHDHRSDDVGDVGHRLLKASRTLSPRRTVLMTAYGTVENAVEAMKLAPMTS